MSRRIALVVGVSEYVSMPALPASSRDAEVMAHVLRNTAGFDDVRLLLNPDHGRLNEAIELLFSGRERDDLVLLFFSGHGVKDERGFLHLAAPGTRKHANGELVRATAVACRAVHDAMQSSRSRRQVVVLDCCFSAAFAEGMLAKDGGELDLRAQLGGEGRAVLASSSSTQYSFDTSESGLSLYTEYLVHGIVSGEADLNHDGLVTVDELHEYAKARVQAKSPAMSPQILPIREGYSIVIASAQKVDPRRAYAAKVREVADADGQISRVAGQVLALRRAQLGLGDGEARAIEEGELGSRRARAGNRMMLRKAVHDARRRGRVGAERGLLNELRVAVDLTEADLHELTQEPMAVQRRMVLGWMYWPERALRYGGGAAAIVALVIVAPRIGELLDSVGASGATGAVSEVVPEVTETPSAGGQVDPSGSASERETPTPTPRPEPKRLDDFGDLPSPPAGRGVDASPSPGSEPPSNPDITSTTWVLHLASKKDLDEARRLAATAAASELDGQRLRPQIVRHSGLYCVLVGPYSQWDAERLLPTAKYILGQGGYVRDMRRWCTYLDAQYDGVRRCYR